MAILCSKCSASLEKVPNEHKITQVAIRYLRNTGTDPLEKQFDPLGGLYSPPSVKYLDD